MSSLIRVLVESIALVEDSSSLSREFLTRKIVFRLRSGQQARKGPQLHAVYLELENDTLFEYDYLKEEFFFLKIEKIITTILFIHLILLDTSNFPIVYNNMQRIHKYFFTLDKN